MRVLITGASGFIGSHLFNSAPATHEVWGVRLNAPSDKASARMLNLDLRDPVSLDAVVRGVRPAVIIHTAAYSRVSFCEDHPTAAWEMNTLVTAQVAETCLRRKIRLLFLSSDMVFDGAKGYYSESDSPNPINFYGRTKLAAEDKVLALGRYGVVARINLTYGKPLGSGHSFSEEIIQTLRQGRNYPLFADQRRSFISIRNLVQALWELAAGEFQGVVHLGGSEPCDRYAFGLKLAEYTGLDAAQLEASSLRTAPRLNLHPPDNTFDVSLAAGMLKTRLVGLDEGLELEYSESGR